MITPYLPLSSDSGNYHSVLCFYEFDYAKYQA